MKEKRRKNVWVLKNQLLKKDFKINDSKKLMTQQPQIRQMNLIRSKKS